MVHSCDVVQDLLPLYIDDVCSGASANVIRAHLEECPKCREMLRFLREDSAAELPPDGEAVLKKTSYVLSRRAVFSALGILAMVVYWLVFFWQEKLAAVGDYRWFSYRFHEMMSLGLIIVPSAALIWLLVLLHRTRKQKSWRKNGAMLLVLLLLVAFHTGYFRHQQGSWSTTALHPIQEVPDEYHIIIEFDNGPMVLEVTPMVANLVETDGTVYLMTFQWNERNPNKGVLEYIEVTDIRREMEE